MNNKNCERLFFTIILVVYSFRLASGQSDSIILKSRIEVPQADIADVFNRLTGRHSHRDSAALKGNGPFISVLPSVNYTMQTGFTAALATSTTFYTDIERSRVSRIMLNGYYSQFNQYWFLANNNIFFQEHKIHLYGDSRYYKFPTQTYGLGDDSQLSEALQIDYSYLRFHQIVFREIASNTFVGMGYNLDYHWNIKADTVEGDAMDQFVKYQNGDRSVSSGVSLNFVYDSRKNSVNPKGGTFVNLQFRPNMTILGSDENWQALLIEIRHYIKLPSSSRNILALWSYNNFTLSGAPPYLDMPSIGWDDYSNTGRGYAAGRYTGKNLIYLETEYRFSITRNGFFGGVLFGNLESVAQSIKDIAHTIIPAGGAGIRIKLSKNSDTNLSIDYGIGIGGSSGFAFNVGEVF
jgi:hypothetical protein